MLYPLPTNQLVLDEISNIFYKFLWDGKGDKIKRRIMMSDYENGGLQMPKKLHWNWMEDYNMIYSP